MEGAEEMQSVFMPWVNKWVRRSGCVSSEYSRDEEDVMPEH